MFIVTEQRNSHPLTTKKLSDASELMPTNQILMHRELTLIHHKLYRTIKFSTKQTTIAQQKLRKARNRHEIPS